LAREVAVRQLPGRLVAAGGVGDGDGEGSTGSCLRARRPGHFGLGAERGAVVEGRRLLAGARGGGRRLARSGGDSDSLLRRSEGGDGEADAEYGGERGDRERDGERLAHAGSF